MLTRRLLLSVKNNTHQSVTKISQLEAIIRNKSNWTAQNQQNCSGNAFLIQNARLQCYSTGTTPTGLVQEEEQKQSELPKDSLFGKVLKKVGIVPSEKTLLRVSSHLLYESVADRINYMQFFEEFKLPNTFNSWFLVTELHVWMLLVRAMAEGAETGEDGRFMRNCIVEVMWKDVNTRAKKLGDANPSLRRKQTIMLSEQFQAALIAYDEGIMSDDRVLAGALWRRFFEMKCEDFQKIERLVKYVRQQVHMLDQMPREAFLKKPKINWTPLDKVQVDC